MTGKLYEQLVADTIRSIADGVLRPGDKMPSIREASCARRLSITTVRRAYSLLENRGVLEGRPQSGYFVCAPHSSTASEPLVMSCPEPVSSEVDVSRFVLDTLKAIQSGQVLPLGAPYPDPALFPWRGIAQRIGEVARRFSEWSALNDLPPGHPGLIRQIARRHQGQGLDVQPAEIVVTFGATEAINLCLQAVAKPGDTVAVESPTFYVMLQAIERLGMRAIEVPTCPHEGLDLGAFEQLLQRQRIDACLVMPNFQNPLGYVMPDEHKRALVELAARFDLPLIEDGVTNELYFDGQPPRTLKSFDKKGLVLHCSSFSKSLTAGVRVGWALPGRYRAQVEKLKFLNTRGTSTLAQMALADYLEHGGWALHLRRVRQQLMQRRDILCAMVSRFFPAGTRMSQPKGGYLLWLELPEGVDSLELYRRALGAGITVTPGRVFSNSDLYRRCIRLNYSYEWTPAFEVGFKRLAQIASSMANAVSKMG